MFQAADVRATFSCLYYSLQTDIWFPNTLHTVVVNVCACMRARQKRLESCGWSEEECNVTLLRVSHLSPPSCRCIHPEHTRVDRNTPGQARPLIYVIFKALSFFPSLPSQAHWPLIFLLPLVLRVQPFPSFCITPLLIFPCCSPFHSYIQILPSCSSFLVLEVLSCSLFSCFCDTLGSHFWDVAHLCPC